MKTNKDNIFKRIRQWLDGMHMFKKWVRIRWALAWWCGLGLLVAFIILGGVTPLIMQNVKTYNVSKEVRDKNLKAELQKARKYDKIEKENLDLKKFKNTSNLKIYKMDLIMRLYDYYKEAGTLQVHYWINKKLFEEVYDGSVASKSLNPSFDKVYFRAYPAEDGAIKTIVIRKNPDVSGAKLEKLIVEEEKRYLNLVYPLVIFGKCKKESNFNKKCESINYKKDKWGAFVLDKAGKKQFKSIDVGIVQMNYCNLCGEDKAKCNSIKNKPIGDGYCTLAWTVAELKKVRPNIASRSVYDIEKNLSLRAIHTEDLIQHYKSWCFIDWEFTGMLKMVMWNTYYPEMFELVGY